MKRKAKTTKRSALPIEPGSWPTFNPEDWPTLDPPQWLNIDPEDWPSLNDESEMQENLRTPEHSRCLLELKGEHEHQENNPQPAAAFFYAYHKRSADRLARTGLPVENSKHKSNMNPEEITRETPLMQMTAGQFADFLKANNTGATPTPEDPEQGKRYVYGLRGIMQLFNVSNMTAQRYKNGIIKEAVTQYGRKIVVDADRALELFKAAQDPLR